MMQFLADENFNNDILRGIQRRVAVTILRVQDTELLGKPDPVVLQWAADNDYILLSHDVNTMRGYFYDRVAHDLPVPVVFLVHGSKPVGEIVEALELIVQTTTQAEWAGELHFLPL
jgi:hypothetical protein